jgi:hypothetical protein
VVVHVLSSYQGRLPKANSLETMRRARYWYSGDSLCRFSTPRLGWSPASIDGANLASCLSSVLQCSIWNEQNVPLGESLQDKMVEPPYLECFYPRFLNSSYGAVRHAHGVSGHSQSCPRSNVMATQSLSLNQTACQGHAPESHESGQAHLMESLAQPQSSAEPLGP